MYHWISVLLRFIKAISVEPPGILIAISVNSYAITYDLGMYRVICDKTFNARGGSDLNNHTSFECWDTTKALGEGLGTNGTEWWPKAEVELQQKTTAYFMAASMTTLCPIIVANIVLGAYGDRRGRKGVLLLGILGSCAFLIPYVLFFAQPLTTPLYIAFIINFVSGFSGGLPSFMASSSAYLADTIRDGEMLTVRMSILQISMTVGIVLGPLMVPVLINSFGYVIALLVALAFAVVAFVYVLIFIKPVKPISKIEVSEIGQIEMSPEAQQCIDNKDERYKCFFTELTNIIFEIPRLFSDAWRTVFKKREAHHRAYVFVAAYSIFVFSTVDATFNGAVFTLYAQLSPLNWTQDEISYFRSVANLVRLIGATLGVFLFKTFFRMSDSFVVVLAFGSMIGQAVLITSAKVTRMMYAAAITGTLSSLSYPCMQALVAKIMKADEIGKTLGAFSMVSSIAFLFASVGMGAIYHATVAYFPAFIFLVCTGILFSGFLLALWLHLDSNRGAIGNCCRSLCADEKYSATAQ